MSDNLTPAGAAAVRLAVTVGQLRRERDRARDVAVALEQRLAYVQRTAETLLLVHSKVVMDTPEDRDLHARSVETFRTAITQEDER